MTTIVTAPSLTQRVSVWLASSDGCDDKEGRGTDSRGERGAPWRECIQRESQTRKHLRKEGELTKQ